MERSSVKPPGTDRNSPNPSDFSCQEWGFKPRNFSQDFEPVFGNLDDLIYTPQKKTHRQELVYEALGCQEVTVESMNFGETSRFFQLSPSRGLYQFDPSSASTSHSGFEKFGSEGLRKPEKQSSEREQFCPTAWSYVLGSNILPIESKTFGIKPLTGIGAAPPDFTLPKMFVMLAMGMAAANVPLGMWRQHTKRFSPYWFMAALATVPFFIATMLCNPCFLPKPITVLTFGMSVLLGQGIGSMIERYRLRSTPASVFATFRLQVSIPILNHLIELDISSHKKSLCVKRKIAQTTSANSIAPTPQPMLKQILWAGAMSIAAKCMLQQPANGFSPFPYIVRLCNWVCNGVFMPKTTKALTLGMWLFQLIKYMSEQPITPTTDDGESDQTPATPFQIKVSISSWTCLVSCVSPLEYSFSVSQGLVLPTSSPAPPL